MIERRMNAYYYSFDPTGVDAVDVVLSAVACAGKAFHHTDAWNDDDTPERFGDELRGSCPREWIQNAAVDAAKAFTAPEVWPEDLVCEAIDGAVKRALYALQQQRCDSLRAVVSCAAEEAVKRLRAALDAKRAGQSEEES